jgi:hypothetical protein
MPPRVDRRLAQGGVPAAACIDQQHPQLLQGDLRLGSRS